MNTDDTKKQRQFRLTDDTMSYLREARAWMMQEGGFKEELTYDEVLSTLAIYFLSHPERKKKEAENAAVRRRKEGV